MLVKALRRLKIKTATFSFPDYSTVIGKEIKGYLYGKRKFTPEIVHFLYAANRHEKLDEIKKASSKNSVLVMNRYYHSNLVYGIANGLKEKIYRRLAKKHRWKIVSSNTKEETHKEIMKIVSRKITS